MGTVLPFPRAIARTVEAFMMVRYLLVCILSGVVFPQRYPSYFPQDRIKEQRSVFLGELQFCRSLSLCCGRRSAVGPQKLKARIVDGG